MNKNKSYKFKIVIAGVMVTFAILLTLFRHWEISGETWGYWLFARIFAETGKFVIVDRSPLYILYLNLFRWIGYPLAVIVEYIVTSAIVASSLIILLKRYTGLFLAVFATILWIPFLQIAEPPVQSLALACICLAVAARGIKANKFRLAVSYALFICAYMLRSNYLIFLFIFAIGDSIKFFRQKKTKDLIQGLRPKLHYWPIFLVLILLLWVGTMQSPHPWNNAWFTTITWFRNSGKNLRDTSFAQALPRQYISHKYGTFKDKDIYFIQKEIFGDANNAIESILANPRFVIMQVARNTRSIFRVISGFTMVPPAPPNVSKSGLIYYPIALLFILFVLAIFYGALRACKSKSMLLFFIANIFFIASVTVIMPRARYLQPLIPILILSAFWYGTQLNNILKKKKESFKIRQRLFTISSYITILFVLIFFSNGLTGWTEIIKQVSADFQQGEIRVMERRPFSLKASFKSVKPLVQDCNGILSFEHKFFGAFMDLPIDRFYDIWEIPPFGSFDNSSYGGLRPDRIDCVLVSNNLATDIGSGTNSQIRYQNYIIPYVKQMQDDGATIYNINNYGQVIILPRALQENKLLK
ncbi:MAG: hypothetical protein ABII25_03765 [bacterium]